MKRDGTISVFGKRCEKMFPLHCNICILENLEKGITKPLGEFVKRHKRFETFH